MPLDARLGNDWSPNPSNTFATKIIVNPLAPRLHEFFSVVITEVNSCKYTDNRTLEPSRQCSYLISLAQATPIATNELPALPQSFFARPAEQVAPDFIGC